MEPIEDWREVWRDGVAPLLSLPALEALRTALVTDDPQLVQGYSALGTLDSAFERDNQRTLRGACAICYGAWKGDGLDNLRAAQDYFNKMTYRLGRDERGKDRIDHFLAFFDNAERDEMRRELLSEVTRAISQREAVSKCE